MEREEMDSVEGNDKGKDKEITGIRQERNEWRDEERVRMREVQSDGWVWMCLGCYTSLESLRERQDAYTGGERDWERERGGGKCRWWEVFLHPGRVAQVTEIVCVCVWVGKRADNTVGKAKLITRIKMQCVQIHILFRSVALIQGPGGQSKLSDR